MRETEQEQLHGHIEHITFHNEESGFCVFRAKVKGQRELITITGTVASIAVGEHVSCHGAWINDSKHGLQFKAHSLTTIAPTTREGMEKYLASGIVKGIGPHFAKKLIENFGEKVFEVIEKHPERLTQLDGIGKKRKELILSSWAEQKSVRAIMVFLQSYGIGTARAVRIHKVYGARAIDIITENPYRLALDVHGIGFATADSLATKLGINTNSLLRAEAGIQHVLQNLCEQGNCAVEHAQLVEASVQLLGIEESIINSAIAQALQADNLIADTIKQKQCIYPPALYYAETMTAQHILRLNGGYLPWGMIDCDKAIPWVEKKNNLQLSSSQKCAITTVLNHKISIITGGPGVGKTTLINSILKIIRTKKLSIALCAPTGRAAKRLSEATGFTAKTIHRLLEFDPQRRTFKHDQHFPLSIDVLIIDEASMIDIVLCHHLLKAIPTKAAVIIVGDIDQLPSVGPGSVLADLIQSQTIAVIALTDIFRQAKHSNIIINSHRINQGYMPLPNSDVLSDFYTLYVDDPVNVHDKLIQLVRQRIPQHFKCNPIHDLQVLTPMHRGPLGSQSLNIALQQALNPHQGPKITRFGWTFAIGDKVIQTINNYDKETFNGDIGFIREINLEENVVHIEFDHRLVHYHISELDEISLAYAITIHKSQGSEFPIVIIPITTQHYTLLARNLLYTGMTRGKKLVILIGQKKAVGMAIRNNKSMQRLTKLSQRLKSERVPHNATAN